MYLVKYGKEYLHDPRISLFLTDAVVENELNSSSTFSFSLTKKHPLYDTIREHDLENEITVYDGDECIFRGSIVEISKDFQLTADVTCRGELAYLNDSIVLPFSAASTESEETAPIYLGNLFEWLIEKHNEQVDDKRRFVIGLNEGYAITEGEITFSADSYPTTGSYIKDSILETYGGYVTVEHEGDKRIINLLSDFDPVNSQLIDFGVNLLDFTDGVVSDEVATVVIPLGASMKDTEYDYDDGYFLTKDSKPDSSKTYYTHDKYEQAELKNTGTTAAPVYAFNSGVKYFEKVATYKYTRAKTCNPNVTYYYNNKLTEKTHLYYFDYGVQYYERKGNKDKKGAYYKTKDKTPNWDKTYYCYEYSSASDLKHFIQWTDGNKKGSTYYTRTENEFYISTKDSTPVHGKTYYVSKTQVSYSECEKPLSSFDNTKSYFEYDEDNDESSNKLMLDRDALNVSMEDDSNDIDIEDGYFRSDIRIVCRPAVEKYGQIVTTYENTNIKTREELEKYGLIALKSAVSPVRTLEIKAIDLAMIKPDYESIKVGEYIRARSKPHGLDSYFLCDKITYNLNKPDSNTFTLGTTFDTLTGQQNKRINSLNALVNHVYASAAAISDSAKANAVVVGQATEKAEEATSTATEAKDTADEAKEKADKAVLATVDEYVLSENCSDPPEDGWSEDTPEWEDDRFYIWRRTKVTYGDGSIVYSSPAVMTGNSGKDGADAVLLRIDSSRGTVFKNNAVATVLTVRIFYGERIIETKSQLTEAFGSGAYLEWSWLRVNDEAFGVISSTDSRISQNGFCLTITPDDVDVKTTFSCELKA